jgi:hypothetical protein
VAGRIRTPLACQNRIRCEENPKYDDIRNRIYCQLLFPFTHILYIFADDIGGPSQLSILFRTWLSLTGPGSKCSDRPRLVMVLTNPNSDVDASHAIDDELRTELILHFASAIAVLDLRGRHELSPSARFEPLRRRLSQELDAICSDREEQQLLFSAAHLEALLRRAVQHVVQWSNRPFDIIQATRQDNDIPGSIRQHLGNFLALAGHTSLPMPVVASFIAFALILDAYPPGMHRRSRPLIQAC